MTRRSALALTLVTGALAAGAAPAAAQTLGEIAPEGAAKVICPGFCEAVQAETGVGTPSYVIPPGGGVITSWTFRALTPGTAYLITAEYVNGSGGVLGDTLAEKFSPGEVKTMPVRLPVQGGEHLGVGVNGPAPVFRTADSSDLVVLVGQPMPGGGGQGPMQPAPGQKPSGSLVGVEVTLEPDADHDDYGDLTQDLCPTDPKHHDACPKPSPSGGGGGNQGGGSPNSTGGSSVISTSGPAVAGLPHIELSASRRESIRHGFVTVVLSSDSNVTAAATGRPYRLHSTGQSVSANTPTTLRLKLTRKELKSIRKRLRNHRKAVATVTVTVRDAAGGTSAASLSIRLAR